MKPKLIVHPNSKESKELRSADQCIDQDAWSKN